MIAIRPSKLIITHWSILVGVIVLVYHSVFSHNFQLCWDDQWQVINTMTPGGLSIENLHTIFCSILNGQYSPINQLYYTVLYTLFGYSSTAFHVGNLLFHLLNAFLVYILVRFFTRDFFLREKSYWISFMAALLFAVHPVQVETVCWISASKIVLSSFFYLLAIILYLQYFYSSKWGYLLGSVCSCFISMGCKEQAIILGACLLLIDAILLKRNMRSWTVYAEKLLFIIPAIAFFIVTQIANQDTGQETIGYSILDRLIFFFYSLFKYLLMSLFPFKLSYLYPFPFQVGEKIPVLLWIYPFVILFISYLIFINRTKKLLVFCVLFFLLHLLPVLHVLPLPRYVITADRYLYLPYIAFAIGISVLIAYLYERRGKWILYASFIYYLYLGIYATQYAYKWKNSDTLKEHFKELLNERETNTSINIKNQTK